MLPLVSPTHVVPSFLWMKEKVKSRRRRGSKRTTSTSKFFFENVRLWKRRYSSHKHINCCKLSKITTRKKIGFIIFLPLVLKIWSEKEGFSDTQSLSLSLSLSHTHKHTHTTKFQIEKVLALCCTLLSWWPKREREREKGAKKCG